MIDQVEFKNYKVLRDSTLPLGRVTVLVGANGSGKSAALDAIVALARRDSGKLAQGVSLGAEKGQEFGVRFRGTFGADRFDFGCRGIVDSANGKTAAGVRIDDIPANLSRSEFENHLDRFRVFRLDPRKILDPVRIEPNQSLSPEGQGLAGVLDRISSEDRKRFGNLCDALRYWLLDFEDIVPSVPGPGQKSFGLRRKGDGKVVAASDLSEGTLFTLTLLTLSFMPDPPAFIGLEEPDRGIHPRLLDHVQDAIYHLAYPENFGEEREPAQVVVTTHSPYLLNLFRDEPEEVVIAERVGDNVRFQRLSEMEGLMKEIGEAPLGEIWFTGVLGGVPLET